MICLRVLDVVARFVEEYNQLLDWQEFVLNIEVLSIETAKRAVITGIERCFNKRRLGLSLNQVFNAVAIILKITDSQLSMSDYLA
ncbi:MAG: hypothetical protein ACTS78_00200 [Arsenophonus sp. NC-WZS1-MAG3]